MHHISQTALEYLWQLPIDWSLAQQISDPDLIGRVQKSFNHFVQTGQVWALLIGLIIGYMLRNLTSYG